MYDSATSGYESGYETGNSVYHTTKHPPSGYDSATSGYESGMKLVIVGIAQLNMQVHLLICLIRKTCRQSKPIKQTPKCRHKKL